MVQVFGTHNRPFKITKHSLVGVKVHHSGKARGQAYCNCEPAMTTPRYLQEPA